MNATANTATYRSILQNLVCDRYASPDEAYCAIDMALEAEAITRYEARKLEARVDAAARANGG